MVYGSVSLCVVAMCLTAASGAPRQQYRRQQRLCAYSNPEHTMCKYQAQECPGKTLLKSGTIGEKEKDDILDTHNRLRAKIARGQIRGMPPAENMLEMVWDDELAEIAQRWADQCKIQHDKVRHTDAYSVGQNIAITITYGGEDRKWGDKPDFPSQIKAWFDEVHSVGFSPSHIAPFKFSPKAGHFTQIIWSSTDRVGCGFTYFKTQKGYNKLYVCNYGPAGNIIGDKMYTRSSRQFRCARGKVNSYNYLGLCIYDYKNLHVEQEVEQVQEQPLDDENQDRRRR